MDIDPETAGYYLSLPGSLGDALRSVITQEDAAQGGVPLLQEVDLIFIYPRRILSQYLLAVCFCANCPFSYPVRHLFSHTHIALLPFQV